MIIVPNVYINVKNKLTTTNKCLLADSFLIYNNYNNNI